MIFFTVFGCKKIELQRNGRR